MALGAIVEVAIQFAADIAALVVDQLFYWLGWFLLRTLTLGRYPPSQSIRHNRGFVSAVPALLLVIGIVLYYAS